MTVQHISSEETLDLRTRILRPGQPLSTVMYAEDNLPTTFHLGIKLEGQIVCNGTFMLGSSDYFPTVVGAYRLRGMAVATEFQGQNLGSALLGEAENILRSRNCPLLWFNARVSAAAFYAKNGYLVIGGVFDIPGGGPHQVMYKYF